MIERTEQSGYYWALAIKGEYWKITEIVQTGNDPPMVFMINGPAFLSDFQRLIGPIEPPEDD